MKHSVAIVSLALNLASVVAVESAAAQEIDYSRGFCVPQGAELRKENAIVVVDGREVNGRDYFSVKEGHNFFNPGSYTQLLVAFDWGGNMRLEKLSSDLGAVILASYENHTHLHSVDRQDVLCVADGI